MFATGAWRIVTVEEWLKRNGRLTAMHDVLICGAGIAGLTLAYCLEQRGFRPIVVKKWPQLRDGGYMIDFYGPGYDVAEKLGLLPALAALENDIPRMTF